MNEQQNIEVWKDIEGYEGHYLVSNTGKVKSLKHGFAGRILKPRFDLDGYALLNLCKGGIKRTFKLHRLVASAFIENPKGNKEVNHKDFDKKNNSVANLEWCTNAENISYSVTNGRQTRIIPVVQLDGNGKIVNRFPSITHAARHIGDKNYLSMLWNCVNGNRQTVGGYYWKKEPLNVQA